jgi:sodium transport system ATP-binding protein
MIAAHDLKKRFGTVEAVRGVSFTAPDGRITGLLGPNGAGKTTTLRMITTLVRADAGDVAIDGRSLAATPPTDLRRRLGVLPDSRGLYPRLTAREHVRYFGELHGLRGDALEERVESLLQRLDMRDIADRRAAGFSQGERVKVALARALVHDPPNVILDEPTNGLDVMSTRAVRALVQRLKEEGRCVVFSSHVMPEVGALCDEIVVIAHGAVTATGTPAELCEKTGAATLEDAFVKAIGTDEGLAR